MSRPKLDEQRKNEILRALEICVAEHGVAKTTLQKVSDKAGLPRALVRHFVGNRDDMIALLFERMVDRGEETLIQLAGGEEAVSLSKMLDFLFLDGFGSAENNVLAGELWHIARREDRVRAKLNKLYDRVCLSLAERMKDDDIGGSDADRYDAAYTIVTLCYGRACFEEIGLSPRQISKLRTTAENIIASV